MPQRTVRDADTARRVLGALTKGFITLNSGERFNPVTYLLHTFCYFNPAQILILTAYLLHFIENGGERGIRTPNHRFFVQSDRLRQSESGHDFHQCFQWFFLL
jgi:hypothetical protein